MGDPANQMFSARRGPSPSPATSLLKSEHTPSLNTFRMAGVAFALDATMVISAKTRAPAIFQLVQTQNLNLVSDGTTNPVERRAHWLPHMSDTEGQMR